MRKRRLIRTERPHRIFLTTPLKKQLVIPLTLISFLVIIFLSLLSLFLVFRSDLFVIHEVLVEVQPQTKILSRTIDEAKLALDLAKSRSEGRSVFFVDSRKIINEIKNNFFSFKEVSLQRNYPNRLNLILRARVPVAEIVIRPASAAAQLLSPDGELTVSGSKQEIKDRFVSDIDGYLFAKTASPSSLPLINIFLDREVVVGEKLAEEQVETALKIIKDLESYRLGIAEIGLVGWESIPLRLKDSTLVIFNSNKEVAGQVAALHAIVTRHKIEGRKARSIDLRYDKPVVKY
jgi:cell division septal protein FtsQ